MRYSRSINGRTKVMALIASGAVALASCGGSSPRTILVPPPAAAVAPGYDSPQAAAAGYVTGYTKQDAEKICAYVVPAQGEFCKFLIQGTPYPLIWHLGYSMVRGNEAIVVVVSQKWCAGKICIRNTDAKKGLPNNKNGFEHAFDTTRNLLPAVSVVRVGGKWYVALA